MSPLAVFPLPPLLCPGVGELILGRTGGMDASVRREGYKSVPSYRSSGRRNSGKVSPWGKMDTVTREKQGVAGGVEAARSWM